MGLSHRLEQACNLPWNRHTTSRGMTLSLQEYSTLKAEEAGAWAVEAPTRQIKPSQTCHACGQQEKKPLSQRWHSCPCGTSCSRDENAARVLLAWLERSLSGREPADAWREVRPGHPLDESALPSKRETHAIA
ncbi:zinc ribbon domain-containing protein [Halorhodospira halochloris]|uniref:zinc ribbon domain-containing protein n=1 Tax=Halorhodospira halochloris TaxID=1052 RepID=UPI003B75CF3E